MKNILVPTGMAYFPRTYSDIIRVIYRIGGKFENEMQFRCTVATPCRIKEELPLAIVQGRLSFLFCCNILRTDETCKVEYKVYPSVMSALFLLCPVALSLFFLLDFPYTGWQELVVRVVTSAFMCGICAAIFLLMRYRTIRRFVQFFEENSLGIFD